MRAVNRRRAARVALIAALLALTSSACNERSPVFDTPTSPTATGPASASPLLAVSVTPRATMGGGSARGAVLLRLPAPAGGTVVSLTSSHPAVVVPAAVTIPPGTDTADFAITTGPVAANQDVTIVGSTPGGSVTATLSIWPVGATFFSYVSSAGEILGEGDVGRLTPATARFQSWCQASQVKIDVSGREDYWRLTFGAPHGAPLRPGTYEDARDGGPAPDFPDTRGPVLEVSGNGRSCLAAASRFVVHEVELTANGIVRRFWATFEHHCSGRSETFRGDVRVTNVPLSSFYGSCTID